MNASVTSMESMVWDAILITNWGSTLYKVIHKQVMTKLFIILSISFNHISLCTLDSYVETDREEDELFYSLEEIPETLNVTSLEDLDNFNMLVLFLTVLLM